MSIKVLMFTQGITVTSTRESILKDFERAHKHIAYAIRLKLSIYTNSPHKMLALGHPQIEVARRCCKDAYDLALIEGPEVAHAIVEALVYREGPLRDEFIEFVSGHGDFSSLRCLAAFRARVRLVPLVETFVEARHKDIKMEGRAKFRVSPARASLKLRGAEIERKLEEKQLYLSELSTFCSKLRSMSGILQNLDLAIHPAVTSCIQENGDMEFQILFEGRSYHPLVEKIVYRRDRESQFRKLKSFNDDVNPDQKPSRQSKESKTDGGAGEYEQVLFNAATVHFRARASRSLFYSHAPRLPTYTVPISMVLTGNSKALFEAKTGLINFTDEASLVEDGEDVQISSVDGPTVASHVFFRIVHFAPDKQVLVGKSLLQPSDMATCLHTLQSVQGNNAILDLEDHAGPTNIGTASTDGTCIWSVPKCHTIGDYQESVLEWKISDTASISYDTAGLQVFMSHFPRDRLHDIVQQMVCAGALPTPGISTDTDDEVLPPTWRLFHGRRDGDLDVLEAMARAGMASCTLFADTHSEWHLTRHAVMLLRLCATVSEPKRFFAQRSSGELANLQLP